MSSATSTAAASPESVRSAAGAWPDLSLLGVAFIWGVNIPVMKVGLDHMELFSFNASRLAISAVVLAIIAYYEWRASGGHRATRPANSAPLSASVRWMILLYSFLAAGLYQIIFLLGIARTTSGNAALIMTTVPMWTALLAWFARQERLSRLAWSGLLIAFSGTTIVVAYRGFSGSSEHMLGNAIMLVAALTWAGATVLGRSVLRYMAPLPLSAIASVSMLPLHFVLAAPWLGEGIATLPRLDVWLPVVYSGIFSTGVALAMWNFGVRHAGAAHAAVYQNLVPVVAIASAWLVRGEGILISQIFGGVLIISGLLTMRYARLRQRRTLAAMTTAGEAPTPA